MEGKKNTTDTAAKAKPYPIPKTPH